MNRKSGAGSGPFLMEMLMVVGFFIICASVCVLVFARSDRMSREAADLNRAVLEAQSLTEELKTGQTEGLEAALPLQENALGEEFTEWEQGDGSAKRERIDAILKAEDYRRFLPVWDKEWNRYASADALSAAGKELAYGAQVLCGTVDNIEMTEILIMNCRRGAADKGSILYDLSSDTYVRP